MLDSKKIIRNKLRSARKNLSFDERRRATKIINNHLKQYIKRNKKIAIYYAVGSELVLDEWCRVAQKRGARIYLPYLESNSKKNQKNQQNQNYKRMWFSLIHSHFDNINNPKKLNYAQKIHNIPQFNSADGKKIRAHQLQMIILPLVGVDRLGYRLGQGGGYYDVSLQNKYLKYNKNLRKIGVGFSCQLLESGEFLPSEPHDIQLDYFVSEKGLIQF